MEQQQAWWIEYGDDIEVAPPRPRHAGPRHAAPKRPRQKGTLVSRIVRWTIVYAVLYAVAAVVLALHPPQFHLSFPAEPTPSASVSTAP